VSSLRGQLEQVRASAQQGALLREGMTVVIAGRPNAGKSSLLNRLSGRESAIVTEIPGTTRDLLREQIDLDGMPLHVIDTAGLREAADAVEQEGIRRAWKEIENADRLLLVVDDSAGLTGEEAELLERMPPALPVSVIRNKADLSGKPVGILSRDGRTELVLSAKSGAGLEQLREHLKESMGFQSGGEGRFMARRRHLDALARAADHLERAREQMEVGQAGELVAEELRLAQQALGEITGEFTADDLLGSIFSSFCIGK
jgi:tRNA modification GTPase